MFPADCLPTNYIEARAAKEKEQAQKTAASKPTLAAPVPQRPAGPARTLSSTLLSLFPSAPYSATVSAVSSARTSPSATPMPSPGLTAPMKHSWFAPVPKPTEQDITCLPPAWS